MTDQHDQDAPDQRALASEFAGRVNAARAGGGTKVLAAVAVAALAGGVVFGVGYLTRPASKHPATAAAAGSPSVTSSPTVADQPAPTPSPPAPSPATSTLVPETPAAPAPAPAPVTVTVTPPAPTQSAVTQPAPAPSGRPARGRRPGSNGPAQFAAVAGYGCQPSADATFTEHGRWTDGLSGFISVGAGGPNAAGCDGGFDAMPMSGSMSHNAPGNYALWTFRTGLVQQQTCDVSVYIPADSSDEHVGGNPAVYQVFGSAGPAGPELGAFDINQPARRGGWVSEPGWPITAGQLTVRLDSYGIDWAGNTETHAHIAVSAIRVTCVP